MEIEYRPSLEIDPSKYVVVIGPSFTATVLDEVNSRDEHSSLDQRPALTSGHILAVGIQVLLEAETFNSQAEKVKCETLYKNAYELDPRFAIRKLSSSLQKCGKYGDWLKRSFEVDLRHWNESPSLTQIRHLQERGALLVYTHYDDVLSQASNTQPVLLNDSQHFERWTRGESGGILHVHGIYSDPNTVTFNCETYDSPNHSMSPTSDTLRQLFLKRHVIMIGFDSENHTEDPLLTTFAEKYIASVPSNQHTFHLTRASNPVDLYCVHNIEVDQQAVPQPNTCVYPLNESSLSLWRQIEFPLMASSDNQMLSLLVVGKQGAKEISKMLIVTPGVNFALVSSVTYGNHFVYTVSLRVESTMQKDMWKWLLQERRESLLSKGLLAIVMQSGTFVWMRGKPNSEPKALILSSELAKAFTDPPLQDSQPESTAPIENGVMKSFSAHVKEEPPVLNSLSTSEFRLPKNGVKKVPRYTVHKFRVRQGGHPLTMQSSSPPSLKHKRPREMNESDLLERHNALPRSLFERRCSLPVNMTNPPESSQTLSQLAQNLQNYSPMQDPPSYAAIKQALLCDRYKRRQSIQTDPKTLKFLLKSKLVNEPTDLLKLRRFSDPGSYHRLKDRDSFARRKELFLDENRTWAHSYGEVIERRISKWQTQREERKRRGLLAWQNGDYHPGAPGLKYHLLNQLQANGVPTTLAGVNGAAQTAIFPTALGNGGIGSYVYPTQTIVAPVGNGLTGTGSTPSLLYSPFLSPYTLINPYQPVVQVGQPTTYYLPQNTAQDQQKVVYFIPPTTSGVQSIIRPTATSVSVPSATTAYSQLNVANLIAPQSSARPKRKSSDSDVFETEDKMSSDLFKRRQSVPNNLSSLLISPLNGFDQNSDPESPPSAKKMRLAVDMTTGPRLYPPPSTRTHSASPPSPHSPEQRQGLSPIQHHLLQVHRTNRTHQRYNENGGLSNGTSYSPVSSPRSVGQSSANSQVSSHDQHHPWAQLNGDHGSDLDEREIERIIGGAIVSSDKSADYGVSPPHSQLQLWQFLLELLLISANTHLIQWSSNDFEFQINKPGDVAKLWGKVTNNEGMNYQKLACGLRYYFSKGIMSEVEGSKHSFMFNGGIRNYIKMRQSNSATQEDVVVVE